jgi:Calcineurin-like phosphoesterase
MCSPRSAGFAFPRWASLRPLALIAVAFLSACANVVPPASDIRAAGAVEAAFIVVGAGGARLARLITTDDVCPAIAVDDLTMPTKERAGPATVAQRPTRSDPTDSKSSAFPVRVCDMNLPRGASRAIVAGRSLPLSTDAPRRIVVIGDTGCRIKASDDAFQACNDSRRWPFASVAAAAAATLPDLVIHVGDYHYRENACPAGNADCANSPWGYGWDAWNADFFMPARPLLAAAPWIFVRGNHESCNRAGQGWWRFLDFRPPVAGRDCNRASDDERGDYSDPYAVPISGDTQVVVFDSSRVGVRALLPSDPMYRKYSGELGTAFALSRDIAHNLFVSHHPILGFAPDTSRSAPAVYPGNEALQSVLAPINGPSLFPPNVQTLIAGHNHLFEMVSFVSSHPTQLISGNGGAWADAPLPSPLPAGASVAAGTVIETIASTSRYGFMVLEKDPDKSDLWRVEARDVYGELMTICILRDGKTKCATGTPP